MSYFAEIDDTGRWPTNTVLRVLIVPDAQEERGQEYLADDLGLGGTWIRTTEFGAHVGGIYDADAKVFTQKQPYPSWSLDADHVWQPPTPQPGTNYWWDEDATSWVEIT